LAIFIKLVEVTDGLTLGLLSQETTVMLSSAVHGVVGLLRIAPDLPDVFSSINNFLACPG